MRLVSTEAIHLEGSHGPVVIEAGELLTVTGCPGYPWAVRLLWGANKAALVRYQVENLIARKALMPVV